MGNKPYSRMMRVPSASVSAKAKKGFKLLYALYALKMRARLPSEPGFTRVMLTSKRW